MHLACKEGQKYEQGAAAPVTAALVMPFPLSQDSCCGPLLKVYAAERSVSPPYEKVTQLVRHLLQDGEGNHLKVLFGCQCESTQCLCSENGRHPPA